MGHSGRARLLQLDGFATGVGKGRRGSHRRRGSRGPSPRKGGHRSKKRGRTEAWSCVDSSVLHHLSCRSGSMVEGSVGLVELAASVDEDRVSNPNCGLRRSCAITDHNLQILPSAKSSRWYNSMSPT